MNGIELVHAVRAMPDYADMKLVMVTTETEISQMAKALEEGADEYLLKPFTKDALRIASQKVSWRSPPIPMRKTW
jgi:two-component system chemotaxis response regulator CheY